MKIKDQNSKESKVEDTKNNKCGEFKQSKIKYQRSEEFQELHCGIKSCNF